jgi:Leucine-rich repeat (LRR) protein
LNLIGLDLKDFPLDIANFSNLTFDDNWWDLLPLSKLDLSNNEISSIDENIANEKDLSSIRMQNNKL